jgi:hypothetical protein
MFRACRLLLWEVLDKCPIAMRNGGLAVQIRAVAGTEVVWIEEALRVSFTKAISLCL